MSKHQQKQLFGDSSFNKSFILSSRPTINKWNNNIKSQFRPSCVLSNRYNAWNTILKSNLLLAFINIQFAIWSNSQAQLILFVSNLVLLRSFIHNRKRGTTFQVLLKFVLQIDIHNNSINSFYF